MTTGTFACPYCGIVQPHHHTDEQIVSFLDGERLRVLAKQIHKITVFRGKELVNAHAWPTYPKEMQRGVGIEWLRELADSLVLSSND